MGKRILLVEGSDDRHVMWNLCEVRKIRETFEVKLPGDETGEQEDGGYEKLLVAIPAYLALSDLECLAVVVDANNAGAEARWQAIRTSLADRGYRDLPKEFSSNGRTFDLSLLDTDRSVRFGAWIMPDNKSQGMLEDFVAQMIGKNDDMLDRVDGFLHSIPQDKRRFADQHYPKARIHSWLAISERPGRPMGQAINADGHLDANQPSIEPFLNWLHSALVE